MRWFVCFLMSLFAGAVLGADEDAPPPKVFAKAEDIAETTRWFDQLTWPNLKGRPYVEATLEIRLPPLFGENEPVREVFRGFLLAEDKESLTVVSDGTTESRMRYGAVPCGVTRCVEKLRTKGREHLRRTYRKASFVKAMEEVIKGARASNDASKKMRLEAPRLFALSRMCVWQ